MANSHHPRTAYKIDFVDGSSTHDVIAGYQSEDDILAEFMYDHDQFGGVKPAKVTVTETYDAEDANPQF